MVGAYSREQTRTYGHLNWERANECRASPWGKSDLVGHQNTRNKNKNQKPLLLPNHANGGACKQEQILKAFSYAGIKALI